MQDTRVASGRGAGLAPLMMEVHPRTKCARSEGAPGHTTDDPTTESSRLPWPITHRSIKDNTRIGQKAFFGAILLNQHELDDCVDCHQIHIRKSNSGWASDGDDNCTKSGSFTCRIESKEFPVAITLNHLD